MRYIAANFSYSKSTIFPCFNEGISIYNPNQLKDNHCLILHGGGDISPSFYGSKASKHGCGYDEPTPRDEAEWQVLTQAVKMNIPIIGICRGAQMLCAFDGGKLIQHINNHAGADHKIIDHETNLIISSNSCHHQMMVPAEGRKNLIIASSIHPTTGYDDNDNPINITSVPEIVYFPQLRAIGIQGHPEWMYGTPFTNYCSNLIQEFILGDKNV